MGFCILLALVEDSYSVSAGRNIAVMSLCTVLPATGTKISIAMFIFICLVIIIAEKIFLTLNFIEIETLSGKYLNPQLVVNHMYMVY